MGNKALVLKLCKKKHGLRTAGLLFLLVFFMRKGFVGKKC